MERLDKAMAAVDCAASVEYRGARGAKGTDCLVCCREGFFRFRSLLSVSLLVLVLVFAAIATRGFDISPSFLSPVVFVRKRTHREDARFRTLGVCWFLVGLVAIRAHFVLRSVLVQAVRGIRISVARATI